MRFRLALAAVAATVLLAGCSGVGLRGHSGATLQVYVSDDTGAIEDFDHLNVTITEITLKRACDGCDRSCCGRDGHENHDHSHDDRRVTIDVNETIDLTRLQGTNATQLGVANVPNGTYTKIVLHVSEVTATLASGNRTTVTFRRDRLVLNERFTVTRSHSTSFVFDVTVRKHDGNYVLRPQPAKSGTNVTYCPKDGSGGCRCDC